MHDRIALYVSRRRQWMSGKKSYTEWSCRGGGESETEHGLINEPVIRDECSLYNRERD